jgi:hypothetical protein
MIFVKVLDVFFFNINHFGRIKKKIDENLAEEQFRLRKKRDTQETIWCLRNMVKEIQLIISFYGTT